MPYTINGRRQSKGWSLEGLRYTRAVGVVCGAEASGFVGMRIELDNDHVRAEARRDRSADLGVISGHEQIA